MEYTGISEMTGLRETDDVEKKDKNNWATPHEVFKIIENMVNLTFDIDLCADSTNAKCETFVSKDADIKKVWRGIKGKNCYMNPPYSITSDQRYNPKDFLEVCRSLQTCNNCNVVCLVSSNITSSSAFQETIGSTPQLRHKKLIDLYFYPKRIRFYNPVNSSKQINPPFSSMLIYFRKY